MRANAHVEPYDPSEFIQTAITGNRVSKRSIILGSQNIILGGKCIIHHAALVRGDLKRSATTTTTTTTTSTSASTSTSTQQQPSHPPSAVVITMGRYCVVGEGSVIRPAYKTYKGVFSYYPLKMGDHVHVGSGTILEAIMVGSHVEIGKNCVIGRFSIIKDCAKILDGTVLPPNTVVHSWSVWAGSPGKQVADLEESFIEQWIAQTKDYYSKCRPKPTSNITSR